MSAGRSGGPPGRPGVKRHAAVWAALAVLAVGGTGLWGCGSDDGDDDNPAATTTTTDTDTDTRETGTGTDTGTTAPSDSGEQGEAAPEQTAPSSGGTDASEQEYDPEQDVEGHDIPPPKGSPQEQFEEECRENPGIC